MSPAASEDGQRDLIGAWPRRPERVLSAGDPPNASEGGIEGDRNRRRRAQPDAHRRGGRPRDRRAARRCGRSARGRPAIEQLLAWARELGAERVWAIEDCRQPVGRPGAAAAGGGRAGAAGAAEADGQRAQAGALVRQVRRDRRARGRPRGAARARSAGGAAGRAPSASCGCCRIIARISSRRARAISAGCAGICTSSTPTWRRRCAAWPRPRNLDRLARQLARREQTAQVRICRELIRRIRELAKRVAELDRELAAPGPRPATAGCSRSPAAARSPPPGSSPRSATSSGSRTEARLASYAGVAPLDASSGRQQRHRLNRTGNRRLNRALYTIALTQIRIHPPARDYIARRLAEGKTRREALRALKRQLIRTHLPHPQQLDARAPPGPGHPHPHELTENDIGATSPEGACAAGPSGSIGKSRGGAAVASRFARTPSSPYVRSRRSAADHRGR